MRTMSLLATHHTLQHGCNGYNGHCGMDTSAGNIPSTAAVVQSSMCLPHSIRLNDAFVEEEDGRL